MIARRVLLLAAVLVTGCAHAPLSPQVITRLSPPPASMTTMVKVLCDGEWQGWATPYGSTYAVTAAHVIQGCTSLSWEGGMGKAGHFLVLRDRHSEGQVYVPDYALLSSDTAFDSWATVSSRKPEPGELLWWRLLLLGAVPSNTPGFYIGKDSDGSYIFEGTAYPGSSGSGIFDTENRLIAVLNGYHGKGNGRTLTWATPAAEVFK